MEDFNAMEEFGPMQQQLCIAVPGAKAVVPVLPWREEQDGDTKYEQFTDGIVYRRVDNVVKKCQEKTIIQKTVVSGGVTERYHTLAFWEDRKTAEYVPICHVLNAKKFRQESRLFR